VTHMPSSSFRHTALKHTVAHALSTVRTYWRRQRHLRRRANPDLSSSDSDSDAGTNDSDDDSLGSSDAFSSPSDLSSDASISGNSDAESWDISSDDDDDNHARLTAMETLASSYGRSFERTQSFINQLLTQRVLRPHQVSKSTNLPMILDDWKYTDPVRFRYNIRVAPDTFDFLLTLIKDHPVFANNSPNPQVPVIYQLAIALYRLGHDGNATSVEQVAQWAGCSAGLVVISTRRVMVAVLSLHDRAVRWPTEGEKCEASDWIEAHSCAAWRPGYAMVDGTLIPLYAKPAHFGAQFYDRKSNYSLGVQVSVRKLYQSSSR
jgi:hypothetical protein